MLKLLVGSYFEYAIIEYEKHLLWNQLLSLIIKKKFPTIFSTGNSNNSIY